MHRFLVLAVLLALPASLQAAAKPVKVFILAGQSNMEGKAKLSLLEYQAGQPATRDLFKHLRKDDKWLEREDVWIKFLDRKGKLTVGYGSPKCTVPNSSSGPKGRNFACRSRGWLRITARGPGALPSAVATPFQSFALKSGTGPSTASGNTLKCPTLVVTSFPTTGVKYFRTPVFTAAPW